MQLSGEFRRSTLLVVVTAVVFMCSGLVALAQEPVYGGTLRVAVKQEPTTLDGHVTTIDVNFWPISHTVEMLFAFDADREPVPHLAREYVVSDDGLVHTFHLREGVPFHNGKEMTSEDVVASLERWLGFSQRAVAVSDRLEALEAVDRYTVEMRLSSPVSIVPFVLAMNSQPAAIYPVEVLERAGNDPFEPTVENVVGTGPYRFVEWERGQHVRLVRFEDYAAVDAPASGFAGHKAAYFDEIVWVFVPEIAARMLGVEAGDFHFATEVDNDAFPRYEDDPRVQSFLGKAGGAFFSLETRVGPFSDVTLRHAALAATCQEELLLVYGPEVFWELEPSVIGPGAWHTSLGWDMGLYNQCDPERARELVAQSDYDGSPIRIPIRSGDQTALNLVTIAAEQWAEAGIIIEPLIGDAAAVGEIRSDRANYEAILNQGYFSEHAYLRQQILPDGVPGWLNDERDVLLAQLVEAPTYDQAYAVWEELERLFWEEAASIKIGDFYAYNIGVAGIRGYEELDFPIFWNAWLAPE